LIARSERALRPGAVRRAAGAAALFVAAACGGSSVEIYHFSDYHSHAVAHFADGQHGVGGIARALEFLRPRAALDHVLVFNGGDTMNRGAPAWSDRYGCVEWSWWNGIVDAMAFGNHDADYGPDAFAACARTIDYPILGANVLRADGSPLFLVDGAPYVVFRRAGVGIGVFALAGSDFEQLIGPDTEPVAGVRFASRAGVAREVVRRLREEERVAAVVLIGHAATEEDEELARQVPGIDLILGTHSHRKLELRRIAGSQTWMTSPHQYLTHISRVELTFRRGRLAAVTGELVRMGPDLPEAADVAAPVAELQRGLEADPAYAHLFVPIVELPDALAITDLEHTTTPLARFVLDAVRQATGADVAVSTASSFRAALPPGVVLESDLRAALPYDNEVVLFELGGDELAELLRRSESLRGSDAYAQLSGIAVAAIEPERSYTVATTDYMARVSPAYRSLFDDLPSQAPGVKVRDIVRRALRHDPARP
jgi:5'-nucleotidase / UDP-sugar diphosphatase